MTRVLIIIQNLPVPFDQRVRLECHELTFWPIAMALERRTHRTADHVISTSESYQDVGPDVQVPLAKSSGTKVLAVPSART